MELIYTKDYWGFVYIWFDRKNRRYYIGSHMGSVDDGYVCGSKWMLITYRRRPHDFKRKVIYYLREDSRVALLNEEERWLHMIKEEELCKRYYNKRRSAHQLSPEEVSKRSKSHWQDPEKRASHIKGMSKSWTPERKAAHAAKLKKRWEEGNYRSRDVKAKTVEAKRNQQGNRARLWDVTFVGDPKEKRRCIVENLAQWCKDNSFDFGQVYRAIRKERPIHGFLIKQFE